MLNLELDLDKIERSMEARAKRREAEAREAEKPVDDQTPVESPDSEKPGAYKGRYLNMEV